MKEQTATNEAVETAIGEAIESEYDMQKRQVAAHNLYWSVASAVTAGWQAHERLSERLQSQLSDAVKALEAVPMMFDCKFYTGVKVRIIAYSEADVLMFLDRRGYIDGVGSLIANGLGFIPNGRAKVTGYEDALPPTAPAALTKIRSEK